MVIFTPNGPDGNKYEIRIKRHPENTYFDEYSEVRNREKLGARACTRFMVGEANTTYKIELKLHRGFEFGSYDCVQLRLLLPGPGPPKVMAKSTIHKPADCENGTGKDLITVMEYAKFKVAGQKVMKARFALRDLVANGNLSNETDIKGLKPDELPYVCVEVLMFNHRELVRLKDKERIRKTKECHAPKKRKDPIASETKRQKFWDAREVDEGSFQKNGIAFALGFEGLDPESSMDFPKMTYRIGPHETVAVNFHYRSAEFLEQKKMVKFPPPLYVWTWEDLSDSERQIALKELRGVNEGHFYRAQEAKTGRSLATSNKILNRQLSTLLHPLLASKKVYESLRELKSTYEKGEAVRQYESAGGGIISPVEDQPGSEVGGVAEGAAAESSGPIDDPLPKVKQEPASVAEGSPSLSQPSTATVEAQQPNRNPEAAAEHPKRGPSQKPPPRQSIIKVEPIDLDALPDSSVESRQGSKSRDAGATALERKKKRAKLLEQEIEEREEIARLKRQKRMLEEEIQADEGQ